MKTSKLRSLTWLLFLLTMGFVVSFSIRNAEAEIPDAPVVTSFDYNFTYDFIDDLVVDDAEITWTAVEGATHYRVEIYSGSVPGQEPAEPDDEFVIPGDDVIGGDTIVDLGNGELYFLWIDYQTNHPHPVGYGVTAIAMRAINSAGEESERSNVKYLVAPQTVLYGQVMNARTGLAIEDARIDLRVRVIDNYGAHTYDLEDVYTDEDGMYYIGGLSTSGAVGPTRAYSFDVYHPRFRPSLNHGPVIFEDSNEQIRINAELTRRRRHIIPVRPIVP